MNRVRYETALGNGLTAAQALIAALPIPNLVDLGIKVSFLDGYLQFRPKFFKN